TKHNYEKVSAAKLFLLSLGYSAHRFGEAILRLVEFGDGLEEISASAGQILLSEDVFQNDTDAELLSLLGQPKPLFRGRQRAPRRVDLFGLRLQPAKCFHDLPNDFVVEFRVGCARPAPRPAASQL